MSVLLCVFVVQAIVITIILVVLKKKLDHILIEVAAKQIEAGAFAENVNLGDAAPLAFVVTTHRTIRDTDRERFLKVITRSVPRPHKVDFQVDAGLWGGVIIRTAVKAVDCSLRERLRQAFGR